MAETEPEIIETQEHPAAMEPAADVEVVHAVPLNRPRKVYAGMWGPPEIGAVSIAALALLVSIVIYAFWVIPSNRELTRNKSEADRLDAELISAKSKYGEITSTQDQVDKLVASVDDFETRFLPLPANGQTALYQRLNGLMATYGLVNTTGPDYAPLETADQDRGQESDAERGRARFRSLYPGVYVTTTVEGSYQNLRRFIRDIETGNEFVVISAVELAPSDTEKEKDLTKPGAQPNIAGNPAGVDPRTMGMPSARGNPAIAQTSTQPGPKGKTHGETVSLHIEMAAYFRRPNFVPMGAPQ